MTAASLPDEGDLRLGPVGLPAGRHVHAGVGVRAPVAWVTRAAVPRAGRAWAILSDAHRDTGLVPFLLGHLAGQPQRPWDTEEFYHDPADPGQVDQIDAGGVLEELWDDKTREDRQDGYGEDPGFAQCIEATIAPFSRRFPGLAPPADVPLPSEELGTLLDSLGPRRIGLVPAGRPADVLPLIGWSVPNGPPSVLLEAVAVLRSWEDRFGARLLVVGFNDISLLATKPARGTDHAQRVAAEHWAFCDECAGRGLKDITRITDYLLKSAVWTFWWD